MSSLMIDHVAALGPRLYSYHSLSCVCSYCLALDYCIVQEWSAEIGYLITTSKDGS